jgi:predicted DNA-binding protein (MmcQ/YjbR family)
MNIEDYRDYCLLKPGVTEGFPFDEHVLVFKVMGKMFALTDIDEFEFINLKCEPDRAIELREGNPGITPGYHMNKQQWNSVSTDGSVSNPLLIELIDHSYELIVASLSKKLRDELVEM